MDNTLFIGYYMAFTFSADDPQTKKALSQGGNRSQAFPPDLYSAPHFFTILFGQTVPAVEGGGGSSYKNGVYIHLPLPIKGLHDSYKIDYQEEALGGGIGGVASAISEIVKNPIGGTINTAEQAFSAIVRKIGGAAAGALGDVVSPANSPALKSATAEFGFGAISNPNMGVYFKGVGIRQHQFTWRLIAQNQGESSYLMKMIDSIKQKALPTKQGNQNFSLTYPYVAFPSISGPKEGNIINFSEMGTFITDIDVKYDGDTHPAFFKNTHNPVVIDLTIVFRERSIVTNQNGKIG